MLLRPFKGINLLKIYGPTMQADTVPVRTNCWPYNCYVANANFGTEVYIDSS